MSISQYTLQKERTLSANFNTYLVIILTKTYTSHVSTLLSSFPVKMAAKKRWILLKIWFFWTPKQLFAIHFFVAICIVCPVAIPEPFAHSRGIRLLATHSLDLFDIKTIWNSNIKNFFNFLGVQIKQVWLLFCFFFRLVTNNF